MRALTSALVVSMMLPLIVACGNSDATPQPAAPTGPYGAAPPGYPPAQAAPTSYPPGYVAAPQYPAPTAAPYAQPAPAPVSPYPAAPVATYAPPSRPPRRSRQLRLRPRRRRWRRLDFWHCLARATRFAGCTTATPSTASARFRASPGWIASRTTASWECVCRAVARSAGGVRIGA